MRYHGKKLEGPNKEIIIIPRGNDEPIIFEAAAVLDMSEFDRLCPRPSPPIIRKRTGERIEDIDDPRFKKKIEEYASLRMAYLVLKSLESSEGLEWERVNMNDPGTWLQYAEELKESGFSDVEINRITIGVMNANCLNEDKLEQARKYFLATLEERKGSTSQVGGQNIMSSGDPANGLDSNHQGSATIGMK